MRGRKRKGMIAIKAAILMAMLLGMTALAVDVGYVAFTKTQMQAAADASCLSGGTVLVSGLGPDKVAYTTVATNARAQAVAYAAKHRNGNVNSTFVDSASDVSFGWAKFNNTTKVWDKTFGAQIPNVGGYNMIRVKVRRDKASSTNNDKKLPLFFARILGHDESTLQVDATAVIMPASGIRIVPGGSITANVMPFTFNELWWIKLLQAQEYYEKLNTGVALASWTLPARNVLYHNNKWYAPDGEGNWDDADGNALSPTPTQDTTDTDVYYIGTDRAQPLIGHYATDNNGDIYYQQDFYDGYSEVLDANGKPTQAIDGILEWDLYPRDDLTAGNFGTIDIGSHSNSTSDIIRQITYGVNATDMEYFTNSTLEIPQPSDEGVDGDTGLSAGLKDALIAEEGSCRAVFLFDSSNEQTGDTVEFHLSSIAGMRMMKIVLTGSLDLKHVYVQPCKVTLQGGIGDIDDTIGVGDTVFTPLILID